MTSMWRKKNISGVERSSLKKDLEKELESVRLIDKLVNKRWCIIIKRKK